MTGHSKMDPEVLSMVLDTIGKLEKERITLPVKLEMDQKGEFPIDLIRFMLSPEIALHLIFIPEQYGGLGAGAAEIAVVSERMAKMDLAIATSFLAICLGLALTRRLVELHRGRIWVESAGKDKGSTFIFIIPLQSGVEPETLPKNND